MKQGDDFGDWMSPMVVKELRQGLRSRSFVSAYLLMHALLVSVLLIATSNPGEQGATSGFLWAMVGIPLLVVFPFRGFGAVGEEFKANTLELLHLTRLNAFRIVAGKWLALVLQATLMICTVLPYLVLRYFLGGVNLLTDLQALAWLLFASICVSAATVGVSACIRNRAIQVIFGIAFLLSLNTAPALGFMLFSGPPTWGWIRWPEIAFVTLGSLVILSGLIFGASQLAPPAENHATKKRLLAFAVIGACWTFRTRPEAGWLIFCLLLIVPLCLAALREDTPKTASVFAPFRRVPFGTVLGYFLTPGWISGMLFTLIVIGVATAALLPPTAPMPKFQLTMSALLAGIFLPLFISRLPWVKRSAMVFWVLNGGMLAAGAVAAIGYSPNTWPVVKWLVLPLPSATLMLLLRGDTYMADRPTFFWANTILFVLSLIGSLIVARGPFRETRELIRESRTVPPAKA
jgi:ABC-type transport system involved in multi-copper enzyme maturation permease subunit